MFYYAYFHLVIKYGITFWGNSTDIKGVFQLQKKTMRIIKLYSHQLMHFFIQLRISLLSYIKIT